jgi:predicted Zn finger-like uncharacterized protein
MYFVCPTCNTALRVDPAKVPQKRVEYTCKRCGTASVVQDALREVPPSEQPPRHSRDSDTNPAATSSVNPLSPRSDTADADGTIYHHVSNLAEDVPRAAYGLHCAVKGLDGEVRTFAFQKPRVTIGRGGTDISLEDPLVSRAHAELEKVKETVIVKDLDSTNGTYVNEQQVTVRILKEGDVVRVGNTLLKAVARLKEP